MDGTVILPCTCEHEFQDETYGKGNRVHNVNPIGEAYCTVCTPRALPCERNGTDIAPAPALGMFVTVYAKRPRRPKFVKQ